MEIAKKYGIKYGVIFGIIGVVYAFGAWAINEDIFMEWWVQILLFLAALGFFVAASVQTKKEQGGYATFREAFSAFMIGAIVYMAISTVGGLLLFQVVDTDLGPRLQEKIMVMMEERFENMNMPEEQFEEIMTKMENQDSFSVGAQLKNGLYSLVFFGVIGAISALIIRKNKPEWESETVDSES